MPYPSPKSLVRPVVQQLDPYVPGEQPKIPGQINLNTNENPNPPSPRVQAAIRSAVDQRLRLYPNPSAEPLREKLAALHGCRPENIIVGNGSDELLAMAVRCFVEGLSTSHPWRRTSKTLVQFFAPSYSLYPVLAAIHSARSNAVPLDPNFSLPPLAELKRARQWDFRAALSFITTPNAPSGAGYSTAQLEELCRVQRGVVVLDEAYVDFAGENALGLALKFPHVLVARTFSKAYSLCFQRIGYFIGQAELISSLQKIRDSYNVNGLGQVAALATLDDLGYYRANFKRIITTRDRLSEQLAQLGFHVFPSQTNFILVRPPQFPARTWLEKLRARKILVRWFHQPEVSDYLRITIGKPSEAAALVAAVKAVTGAC